MRNITLSIDDELLKLGREYAKAHRISFNVLVGRLIEQTVAKKGSEWLHDSFEYIDQNAESRAGITWKREDLYRGL